MSTTGKNIKNTNIWRLNNMFLNNQQNTEEIKNKTRYAQKRMKMKTQQPKLWDTVKAVLRGRFIAIQAYLKK